MYTDIQLEAIRIFGRKELSFGCIVLGAIHDIGYDPNGGNGNGYGGETIYRRMIYADKDYSIPLDKELFTIHEVDEEGNTKLFETGYYEGIEDEDWTCCLSYQDDIEILGHIPEIFPDVARVAKNKGRHMEVRTITYNRIEFFTKENPYPICIPYNQTLPLLEQEELTLTQIISLFK